MKLLLSIFIMLFLTSSSFSQSLENLGRNVNSEDSELLPMITTDGKTLYFIRSKQIENRFYQTLWASEITESGNWIKAYKLGDPFNKGDINTINYISVDGNHIVFYDHNYKTGESNFFEIKKSGFSWDKATLSKSGMAKEIYYDQFRNSKWGSFFLTGNGKVYFASATKARDDSYTEIYIGFLNDSIWGRAHKLPEPINIKAGESGNGTPFLSSDNVTLYFSSDRKGGFGGEDIYMSRRLDDTWLNWSDPINLGPIINSSGNETFYTIAAKGDYAYVCSENNSYGRLDIFRIKLPEQVRPNPVVLVSGIVLEPATNKPLDAEISYYILPEGTEAGITRTNPSDGSYKIVLPYGKKYSCIAKVDGYYSISNYIDLSEVGEYKEMDMNLEMKPIIVGETFRLNNIFFDFNEATLRPESTQELDRVVNLLKENSSIEIELSGHTDAIGTDEYNLSLSQRRADAVTNYLVTKGISTGRIISKGYGKRNPVATNDTDEGRQLNRRVEFKILKK